MPSFMTILVDSVSHRKCDYALNLATKYTSLPGAGGEMRGGDDENGKGTKMKIAN